MTSLAFKFHKANTIEEFVGNALMLSKLACLVLFSFVDYRYSAFYGILCLILWLVLKAPKYNGPSKIRKIF